jgi:SOS response regulatory protein OraA/RecX
MEFTKNLKEAEELDKLKSRVLKYVLYKKRTESEVREKFSQEDENKLEDVIQILKDNNYINDLDYIERSIKEFKSLKSLSIREINYKLTQKKVNKDLLDEYIYSHKEELLDFEIQSDKNLIIKKMKTMELEDIKNYLFSKGYMSESINIAFEEIN